MNPLPLLPDHVVHVLGWTFIHFLWQGTAVAGVLVLANTAVGNGRVGLRYAASCAAMMVLVALPLVTAWTGFRSLAVDPRQLSPVLLLFDTTALLEPPLTSLRSAIDSAAVLGSSFWMEAVTGYLPWLVHLWMAGAALSLLRLGGGWSRLYSTRRCSEQVAREQWHRMVQMLAVRMGIRVQVRLAESARTAVPMVVGWLRPVILVPIGLFVGMAPRHIETILAHELAHVRRYDSLVNLLQALAESLLFFHPAVWWVSRRIRIEREFCCDDAVVAVCGAPAEYAKALWLLGEHRNAALAVAANSGGLLPRIRRLLQCESRRIRSDCFAPSVAASLAMATMTIVVASLLTLREDTGVPIDLGPATRFEVSQQDKPGLSLLSHGWMIHRDAPTHMPAAWQGNMYSDVQPVSHGESVFSGRRTSALSRLLQWTDHVPRDHDDRGAYVLPLVIEDPPEVKIWEASDPRYWIGKYEGTADIHRYRNLARPDSVSVIDRVYSGRTFVLTIERAPDAFPGLPDFLAPEADIVVRFYPGGGNFRVDLDLNPVINGRYRSDAPVWYQRGAVEARMIKDGDWLIGTFKSFGRDHRDSVESPLTPVADYQFKVRKRSSSEY